VVSTATSSRELSLPEVYKQVSMTPTLHVVADARGRWRVLDDDGHTAPLSEHTSATDAERAAWQHGADSVLVHDRYGRTHDALPVRDTHFAVH
jgi:hypothetical protein